MSERRALSGDFADIRTVKSRSVVQVVIELPIEEGENIVKMFGFPQPSKPVRVALARLGEPPLIEAQAEPSTVVPINGSGKRTWRDLTPAQQSGIRCNEVSFQRFLREEGESGVNDAETAAVYVRAACGVHSRAMLTGKHAVAWQQLEGKFQVWLSVGGE